MDTRTAAERWAQTWRDNWIAGKPEPIAVLYAPGAVYSTGPFRVPYRGPEGALAYLRPVLADESEVAALFGTPIVDGDRAAVQWWASMVEEGEPVTYAGTSVLRFDADGRVVDEWDTWNRSDGRLGPVGSWVARS